MSEPYEGWKDERRSNRFLKGTHARWWRFARERRCRVQLGVRQFTRASEARIFSLLCITYRSLGRGNNWTW